MNGKGDRTRPRTVSYEEYARNWERAFTTKDGGNMAGLKHQVNVLKRAIHEIDEKLRNDGAVPIKMSDEERRRLEAERENYKKQKQRLDEALQGW